MSDRGWEGVTRVWSASRMVSDHKRQGLVSHGLPIMSALGLGGCHAVRVCVPTVSDHERRVGRVSRLGPWSSMVCGHERSGAGRVSGDSGPWSHMVSVVSDRGWEGLARLGPWSPMVCRGLPS